MKEGVRMISWFAFSVNVCYIHLQKETTTQGGIGRCSMYMPGMYVRTAIGRSNI